MKKHLAIFAHGNNYDDALASLHAEIAKRKAQGWNRNGEEK